MEAREKWSVVVLGGTLSVGSGEQREWRMLVGSLPGHLTGVE